MSRHSQRHQPEHRHRQVNIGDLAAYCFDVDVDGVAHRVYWTPADGALRATWEVSAGHWSRVITLINFSPQHDLQSAADAVRTWAALQRWPGPHIR